MLHKDFVLSGDRRAENKLLDDVVKAINTGYIVSVYASGTPYALTTTSSRVMFGTTSPEITLERPGTYLIRTRTQVRRNNSSHAGDHTITYKLRRVSNTPIDIPSSSTSYVDEAHASSNENEPNHLLPEIIYTTANSNDVIQLWGLVSTAGSGGNHNVDEASIVAERIY